MANPNIRVLVCGGRDYEDRAALYEILDRLRDRHGFKLLITGGAPGAVPAPRLTRRSPLEYAALRADFAAPDARAPCPHVSGSLASGALRDVTVVRGKRHRTHLRAACVCRSSRCRRAR